MPLLSPVRIFFIFDNFQQFPVKTAVAKLMSASIIKECRFAIVNQNTFIAAGCRLVSEFLVFMISNMF